MTQTECGPAVTRIADGAELPAPGRWQIDPGHTELAFIGRHFMLTKVRGRFTGLSGVIEVAEAPGDSTVAVTIDMTTVESGNDARDEHLRSADFFDVAHHPDGHLLGSRGRLAGHQGSTGGGTDPSRRHPAGHPAGRVRRLHRRPLGRPPGRLHRRGHHRPGGLGLDLEPAAGRRRARGLRQIRIEIELEAVLQP